ncbi:hypothetical protein [Aureimonas populi]|uniref:Sodium:proton antiporter n=1 Tax=Aureimonas populi TaxID=1701758 RepID=A0ABW5CP30_9HYPH|nr:hypothetical protein [Aureimonas populi]
MQRLEPPRPLDWALLGVAAAVGTCVLLLSRWDGGMLGENGPVEIAQLAFLALASVFFLRGGLRLPEWGGLSALSLAALSMLFFVREVPRCTSPYYEFGPCIDNGYKDTIYLLVVVAVIGWSLLNRGVRPARFGRAQFGQLPAFIVKLAPLLILVPLIGISQLGDKWNLPGLEEALELVGYMVVTFFGLLAAQAGDRQAAWSSRHMRLGRAPS